LISKKPFGLAIEKNNTMNLNYAIATFCFGDRYYDQTNRMISSFETIQTPPEIFIITDNENAINKKSFTKIKNVGEYNAKYLKYEKNYYSFDFSVKRFALQFAFENEYCNVILVDTDVTVNESIYSHERIMECFTENSIMGQVTYNFSNEITNNSELGKRFVHYEKKFDVEFKKNLLDFMPEDCIQFISISNDIKFKFLEIWDRCIKIKDKDKLRNTPAGNIDEMCFAALLNNIKVGNNSDKHINLLIPRHDKWY
jgi:hypothetical protein